eukprot:UN07635
MVNRDTNRHSENPYNHNRLDATIMNAWETKGQLPNQACADRARRQIEYIKNSDLSPGVKQTM